MPLLRLFFGEAAHSQPCDPAICSCFGVILGCFLLQRGDANPTWLGLTCETGRGIKFWDKSTQGFYSSFSLSCCDGLGSAVVFGLGAAVPVGSGCSWHLQLQGFWCRIVRFCMESVLGSRGSSQCSHLNNGKFSITSIHPSAVSGMITWPSPCSAAFSTFGKSFSFYQWQGQRFRVYILALCCGWQILNPLIADFSGFQIRSPNPLTMLQDRFPSSELLYPMELFPQQ